jgi:hypothetical protein
VKKELVVKVLLHMGIYMSMILSTVILFFNGSFGYFLYVIGLGDERGAFVFSMIALIGALLALIPLLFDKKGGKKFFYYVLLSTNLLIIFYPVVIKGIASYVFPKFL